MTGDYQTETRMAAKLAAIPFPSFAGKRVLDVGTDHGFFAFLAAEMGAAHVLGLDRNREVRGQGRVDLVARNAARADATGVADRVGFAEVNVGRQWREFGRFDVVLVMSVYHHLFENCGSHDAIWYWLWRHCAPGAELIFEGPLDDSDPVVRANVGDDKRDGFTQAAIMEAATRFFEPSFVGPALHEPTRQVWTFRPWTVQALWSHGMMQAGAGGATKAFEHAGERRIAEIESILGWRPVPGSLNVSLEQPFEWDTRFYRAPVLDVKDRSKGLGSEWAPRWARFYPVRIEDHEACVFRFEGERYPDTFVELIAPQRLRDVIAGQRVSLCR
jgi:SAM-dependent methyltransferase